MSGFWYLASVYSKWHEGIDDAAFEASVAAGKLIRAGIPVYSPVAHSHSIAEAAAGLLNLDHELWMRVNMPMMDAACGLIVLMMPGYLESDGVSIERRYFHEAKKPAIFMTWPGNPSEVGEIATHISGMGATP